MTIVVHAPEIALRLCISLVCSLFQHMYYLFCRSSVFDTSHAPWCVSSALIVATIQLDITTHCIIEQLLRPRWQIGAAQRTHLLDSKLSQLSHALCMVHMRAWQTEDSSRSETFKAHRTFIILVVSISRCLVVTCCLLFVSPFVFLCIISTSNTFFSCYTCFCGVTIPLFEVCFLHYSCSVQSGGCSAISRCHTILFVAPLPPVSPLAILAAVECQFAASALVVLENTGDRSFFGPAPSAVGTR